MLNVFILSLNISIISNTISSKKIKSVEFLLMTTLIFIPSYLLFLFNMKFLLVPSAVIVTFTYYFISSKNMHASIFNTVFTQLIFAFSDIVTGIIFIFLLKTNYTELQNNYKIYLMASLTIGLVSFSFSKIVYKIIERQFFYSLKNMSKRSILVFFSCIITILILIYSYSRMVNFIAQNLNITILFLNFFIMLAFLILFIIVYYKSLNIRSIRRRRQSSLS